MPNDLFALLLQATQSLRTTDVVERHLSDLSGCFVDSDAYQALLPQNPLIYSVSTVEPGSEAGDLHFGLGTIQPGCVGPEYYFTKGHLHAWRPAAELYIGLTGLGGLLLEGPNGENSRFQRLDAGSIVYVPGHTAHRTVNVGDVPFSYLGVYPATAGHDYRTPELGHFQKLVLASNDGPIVTDRTTSTSH